MNTPIIDFRYYCLWRILIPYLVNIKGFYDIDVVYSNLDEWLSECNKLRNLITNPMVKSKE